jgi:hypothetical protein
VDHLGRSAELRTDLANAVAQGDHVIEVLVSEHAQVRRRAAAYVDASFAHHPDGVRVQRLGVAARAGGGHRPAGQVLKEGLGHLRPGAVPGAQGQHAGPCPGPRGPGRDEPQSRMQRRASRGQQFAAAREVDGVVGVPAIGRTAPRRHQPARPEPGQMVRDQALRLAEEGLQLADLPVAARKLAEQSPPNRMPRQPQELRSRLHP